MSLSVFLSVLFPCIDLTSGFLWCERKKKKDKTKWSVYDPCLLVGDLNPFGSARSPRNLNDLCLSHSKSVLRFVAGLPLMAGVGPGLCEAVGRGWASYVGGGACG